MILLKNAVFETQLTLFRHYKSLLEDGSQVHSTRGIAALAFRPKRLEKIETFPTRFGGLWRKIEYSDPPNEVVDGKLEIPQEET